MFRRAGKRLSRQSIALLTIVLIPTFPALCADRVSKSHAHEAKLEAVRQITHDGIGKTNLLSDGSNLYVSEWPAAHHVVAKVSLQTSTRSLVSSNFKNLQALAISPDLSKLLISPLHPGAGTSENEFWILPVNNGKPERLGKATGRDASWSPDGRQLVFCKGTSIFLANADGGSAHEIFKADGPVFAPRISSDGKRVRFTQDNSAENNTSLWEIGIDGSKPHDVLDKWRDLSNACCGSWTADGHYYIFQVTQSAPTALTSLWALADSGRNAAPFQLTTGPISFGSASPSRDRNKLWAIGVLPTGEAVKYSPARNKFTPLLAGVSATDLNYSADGKWVTYVSVPDAELYRCRADGKEQMRLTSAPERVALPQWSKDAKQIAYVSMLPGKPWRISVMSAAGGASRDILADDQSQIDANWSPDGHSIMFGYARTSEHLSIKILDLSTHKVQTVPGSEGLFSPRWSPNGRYVAALTPDFTKVMLFDFRTGKWSKWLNEPAGAVNYPVWSADSRSLYFDDLVTDEEAIRKVSVGQHRTERVFKLQGIERYPGPFGLWSGRMPDGSWMFVRDHSTQEVYQLSLELP
jgi:Tol biopolymer transport system component